VGRDKWRVLIINVTASNWGRYEGRMVIALIIISIEVVFFLLGVDISTHPSGVSKAPAIEMTISE